MGNAANCNYCENRCKCSLCSGKVSHILTKIITNKQHIHDTVDKAAMDAAYHIYKLSSKNDDPNTEYGVTIYKKYDNKRGDRYYLSEIKLRLEGQIEPDNDKTEYTYVAHVHSHPHHDEKGQKDTTGQTFSLLDYIIYYKTRVIKEELKGIIGYLVSHIDNIEFTKSIECVLGRGQRIEQQHCKRCLIPNEPRPSVRRRMCEICPVKCKECIKTNSDNNVRNVGKSPVPLIDGRGVSCGALIKFTSPLAEDILPEGYTVVTPSQKPLALAPNGYRVVGDGQDGIKDEKLNKWNEYYRDKKSDDSHRLRRCLFRKHIDITPIVHVTAINDGGPTWYSGKDIIFP